MANLSPQTSQIRVPIRGNPNSGIKPTTATNHFGTLQLKQKPPRSQSAPLLFDDAFQGDYSRSGMRWRSAPCGSAFHLISLHVHFNVKRAFAIWALWNVKG